MIMMIIMMMLMVMMIAFRASSFAFCKFDAISSKMNFLLNDVVCTLHAIIK